MEKHTVIFALLCLFLTGVSANEDSLKSRRLHGLIAGESILFGSSLIAMNSIWYQGNERTSFHFFNDNNEWLQMDKAGHMTSAFYVSRIAMDAFRWTGMNDRKSAYYGGGVGLLVMSSIEIFDGFSEHWGASLGDMAANATGAGLLIGQELIFSEQVLVLKYSFSTTPFPKYRPELLGENLQEQLLKDYNGQTYWASLNTKKLLGKQSKLPAWLCVSFGYSADGMTGGMVNPTTNEAGEVIPDFKRYRQYYLSLDVDFTRINTRSKFLKTAFKAINFLKFPFPALEWNQPHGIGFNYLSY